MAQTPNRSAGRLGEEDWDQFLAWARWMGLSNSDAMRELIRAHCIVADGDPPRPAGRHARLGDPAPQAPEALRACT